MLRIGRTLMLQLLILLQMCFMPLHAIGNIPLGLAEMISNLMTLSNTELVIISDFNNENKVRLFSVRISSYAS